MVLVDYGLLVLVDFFVFRQLEMLLQVTVWFVKQ
jgi:hypothetical protein